MVLEDVTTVVDSDISPANVLKNNAEAVVVVVAVVAATTVANKVIWLAIAHKAVTEMAVSKSWYQAPC